MGEKESIVLQASSLIGNAESLKEHLNSLHPEFIVYQYPSGGVLFIFKSVQAAHAYHIPYYDSNVLINVFMSLYMTCWFCLFFAHSRPEAASIQVLLNSDKIRAV